MALEPFLFQTFETRPPPSYLTAILKMVLYGIFADLITNGFP